MRYLYLVWSLILFQPLIANESPCFNGKKLILTKQEWKERLTKEQYRILRKGGTEPAYTSPYLTLKKEGTYHCAGCGLPLFSSKEKYDSNTGWPSFWAPICPENVSYQDDFVFFQKRIEVICSRCEGHLGHLFEDGPPPTGKRFCINGEALQFKAL